MIKHWNNSSYVPVRIYKICSSCREKKSINLFTYHSAYGDKRSPRCKICSANSIIKSRQPVDSTYIDKLLFNTEAYATPLTMEPFSWDENGFILTESGDDPMTSFTLKKCNTCGETKIETQFHKLKTSVGRRSPQCRKCKSEVSKKNRGLTMAELAAVPPSWDFFSHKKIGWEEATAWHQARDRRQDIMHRITPPYPSNEANHRGAIV